MHKSCSIPVVLLVVVLFAPSLIAAQDDASEAERESLRLHERLRNAPAPPMPPMPIYSDAESRSALHRSLISFDPVTGETVVLEAAETPPAAEEPVRAGSRPGLTPVAVNASPAVLPSDGSPGLEGIDDDALVAGSCTPPSPNVFTHTFPWTTNYKLLMRFVSGGTDYFYVCSAASMGSFHLLTAGHCLYNHDPNNDGNTSDAAWATEVWAWAAQTDLVNPYMTAAMAEDRPYGFAKANLLRSYTGWTASGDLNHDMGFVTLDRRDGDHTGWMGREAGVDTSGLNFNGYPAETPYVPGGEIRQYPGFNAGNVDFYTEFRIRMCAFIYGGHSGGPDWRFDVDRFIQGVNSTSDRMGSAEATRLTVSKFNDIDIIIADDEVLRPPVARPDLAEFFFTTVDDRKDLLVNSVTQGDTFQMEYSVVNAGFAATSTITVDFYLSTNSVISTGDTLVGTVNLGSLNAFTFTNPIATLTANIAPGTYYAGWIMRSAVAEYGGDLPCSGSPCTNVAVIADETLTVNAPTCSPDGWEPDNSAGQASGIVSGLTQTHSICAAGDEDWVTFTLSAAASGWQINLATFGPGADDTRMWLYNSGLAQVEFDDDDGAGLFSFIDRTCAVDPLPPGTYYVQVDEFGDDEEIDTYFLDLGITPCSDDIFTDGFESGNTAAWSATVP